MNANCEDLIRDFPIWLPAVKFRQLYRLLANAESVPGDMAEVGVYRGGTSAAMAYACQGKRIHCFDTFTGLPETEFDEPHNSGDFSDTSVEAVRSAFKSPNFELRVGHFPETFAGLEDKKFSFVHIDGDYYETTRDAIALFWPRMSIGGVMLFDDYKWQACPGVERAIAEAGLTVQSNRFDQAWVVKK